MSAVAGPGEVGVVGRGTTHTSNGERDAYGREGDRVIVLVQEVVRAPDLLAHQPAVRALALADEEPRRAAQLLRDPVRDLRQVVEVEAQVVGPGARLRAPVLDDLEVLRSGRPAAPRRSRRGSAASRPSITSLPDRVERAVLAGRRDDRAPRAGGPRVARA